MKQLRNEFLNNEITLDELMIESIGIAYLHPNIDFTRIEEIDKEEERE